VWPDINASVFVVHDTTDKEVNFSCHQAWLEAVPHAKDLVTDGLGHRRIIASEEVIEAGIAFLAEDAEDAEKTNTADVGQEASNHL
jgi:hypothetical protein